MKYVFLKLILTAFTVLTLSLSVFSANAALITVTPNVAGPINVGDFFSVDLIGTGIGLTQGGSINVTYNSIASGPLGDINMTGDAVINFFDATTNPTGLFDDPAVSVFSDTGIFDNGAGTLTGLRMGTAFGVGVTDGSVLATLNFQATSVGFIDIIIDPFGWGFNGVPIITDPINATVQVSAIPLPPAVLLFGSALLGLISIRRKQA